MESNVSGHWTEDELIAHLYGIGPEDHHVDACAECQARLSAMQARRQALDTAQEGPGFELLAGQRRSIYAKLTASSHWWLRFQLGRWASAAAALFVLAGGLAVYQEYHHQQVANNAVSDAQLAQEVSGMAQDSEPQPTAPLQALFEE